VLFVLVTTAGVVLAGPLGLLGGGAVAVAVLVAAFIFAVDSAIGGVVGALVARET
jgi:hypothetical protein